MSAPKPDLVQLLYGVNRHAKLGSDGIHLGHVWPAVMNHHVDCGHKLEFWAHVDPALPHAGACRESWVWGKGTGEGQRA